MSSEEFTPETPDKPKRKRRTQAEMAAARAENKVSQNKSKAAQDFEASYAKVEGKAPEIKASAKAEPDKMALARKRREASRAKRELGGALEGQQLIAPTRPGFVRRWVNDEKGKLDRRQDRGYTFVEPDAVNAPFETNSTDLGSKTSQRVGTLDGKPLNAYLMEIPEEFYQEDQQTKETANIQIAHSAQQGAMDGGSLGSTAYTPDDTGSQFELPHEQRRR